MRILGPGWGTFQAICRPGTAHGVAVVTQEQSLFRRLASSALRRKLVRGLKRLVGYRGGAS